MINIQSAMLVALGFLVANLLVLLLAPAYWHRAVRLTTQRLKQSMPLTEAEIRADKDRLRAEYAIRVHQLEVQVERSTFDTARQQIELNRRDAAISTLEGEIARISIALDEHSSARRVLEQTIADRFPRMEARLAGATKLLAEREHALAALTETSRRQARALEEAAQLSAKSRDEVMRLSNSLEAVTTRRREGLADNKLDVDVALRTELETLRNTLHLQLAAVDQAQTGAAQGMDEVSADAATALDDKAEGNIAAAQALIRGDGEAARKVKADSEAQLVGARSTIEDQAIEIARLKAAVAAYEMGNKDERTISLRDNKLTMKVRLSALQAETEKQSTAIQRLRTELAAANEKLAKQAAHYVAEMRRFGGSSANQAAQAKSGGDARRAAGDPAQPMQGAARAAMPLRAVATGPSGNGSVPQDHADNAAHSSQVSTRMRGFLKAIGGAGAVKAVGAVVGSGTEEPVAKQIEPTDIEKPQPPGGAASRDVADKVAPRNRLIERIAGVTKS